MLISLVSLVVISSPAWGLSGARLISLSQSGQTALFNLGTYDGVKEGDFAVVVKEIRDLDTRDLRLVPVAKARNVKINTQNSVWILYKFYGPDLLHKGDDYLVLSESTMLSGRRDPRLGRIQVITEKDKTTLQVKNTLSDDHGRLAKLKTQYPEIEVMHGREERSDKDVELVDVAGWSRHQNGKYATALYKSPHSRDFQRELRLNSFEKIVTAYLRKVNEPGFNYDAFYDEQKKTAFSHEFRQRSNFGTEYEMFKSAQSQKAVSDAKLHRSLLEKGGSWSEDYSDEELGRVLKEVSVLQEKDRREYVAADPKRYAVYVGYGMSLNDPQTEKDSSYRRDGRYAVDLDFEATPILKHEGLERFTLNAALRMNKTAMETESKNASVDEVSISAGVNWYPLYAPHALEAPAVFLGTYIRSGTASVEAVSVKERSNYTLLAMPGFRTGMRYNFKNNIGLRIALSMETLKLDRYEQNKLGSVLPDQASLFEGKMNFALAYSF